MHWSKDAYKKNTKQHLHGGKRERKDSLILADEDDIDMITSSGDEAHSEPTLEDNQIVSDFKIPKIEFDLFVGSIHVGNYEPAHFRGTPSSQGRASPLSTRD